MAYVSCRYAPPPAPDALSQEQMIICTDENGVEWHLTEDSQVGDWLTFQANEDNFIEPYEAPETREDDPDVDHSSSLRRRPGQGRDADL